MSSPTEQGRAITAQAAGYASVAERIGAKVSDYGSYGFSPRQTCALNVFFDLAQEFDSLEDLYSLAVLVLKQFFDLEAELYTLDPSGSLVRRSPDLGPTTATPPLPGELAEQPAFRDGEYRIPVRGRSAERSSLPVTPVGDALGMLVVHPRQPLTDHQILYLQKYANRVGFQLHNKLMFFKNREHIRFIRSLVHDIGHNVIVPNMYFKLLFRQLEGKIQSMSQVRETLLHGDCSSTNVLAEAMHQLGYLHERLEEQYSEIYRHFQQSSMFLETLLRQSHFDQGHYVLQKSHIDLLQRVVLPQVERFKGRLEEKGVKVCMPLYDDDTPRLVLADTGLISQVIANLLSNAVKYTRPDPDDESLTMCCRIVFVENAFGEGKPAVRVEVCTSGPPVDAADVPHLFEPDFRGRNTTGEYGTGHGLHFVREIVDLHGGHTGYHHDVCGNVFWFELPYSDPPS